MVEYMCQQTNVVTSIKEMKKEIELLISDSRG